MTQDADLAQRLAYLDFDAADLVLLKDLGPLLEKHADAFVAHFYRHLLSFDATRDLLRDPAVKDRLLLQQRQYLLSLAAPSLDEEYIRQRRHIGEVHERIGLEPRWYLGAYTLYQSLLTPLVCEGFGHDPNRAMGIVIALQKLLTFDAQLAMETYIERDRVQLEYLADELARAGRELERDYRDQTAELRHTEERARASEQLADVATLVAGLAHEVGTPMGVIQGHAKLLERAVGADEDALWRLRTIQEQIARISKIIQTLLKMARPGTTTRVPIALAPLLTTTLSFVSEKLARRGISETHDFEDVPSIIGDPERLQQLFLNLFLNAADAMPEGGKLRVSLARIDAGVEVRVADTGSGIREADLHRVFDPFFTTKEAGHGNGLGLMVTRDIVGDHGGSIEVSSRVGKSTEFRVVLPEATSGDAPES